MSRLAHLSIPNLIASEIIESSFPSSMSYAGAGLTPFEGRLLGSERCFFGDVKVLDLSNNIGFCDGIMHLCEALLKAGSAFSLRELELRKIGISPVTAASLVKLVSAFPIQKLDVSDNRTIGDAGVSILAAGLRNNGHLSTLKMRDVGLTAVGVNSLAELLLQNATISTLDIGQNAVTCEGIVILSLPLHTNKTLTSLGLSDCKILPPGTMLMAEVMKTSKLRSLDMSVNAMCGSRADNSFDPAPILQLADSIHDSNRTLSYLNLSRSDIGARSTRRLMFALSVNPHLRTLVIDSCNISEEGAVHVGEGLPLLLGLETLQISSCGVGPIGCERIFLGLIHNTSVTSLDVSGNQLTGYLFGENNNQIEYDLNAVRAISAALASNTTLRYLNLSNNR
jgi:Ran GTPase-activating protein (RanGAP) involved in mRNA processing and transport